MIIMVAITYGTFDFCHQGHINLLKRIKAQCDYLIIGLSTEDFNQIKGKAAYYSYDMRKKMLMDTGLVDLIIPEKSWGQKANDIQKYHVDKFYMGRDWLGQFDELAQYCPVIYLPRTPGISSTELRENLGEEEM